MRRDGDDLLLMVKGRPGARKNALMTVEGDAIKVAIAAAPERGRATEQMLRFLASEFDVPRAQAVLVSGEFSPMKRVRIERPRRIPPLLEPFV